MDMSIYQREFQGKPIHKFSKRALNQQLAMAGLLSFSTLVFQHHVMAADLGSQNADTITLQDQDKITADLRQDGILYGILNDYSRTANINLANNASITAVDTTKLTRGVIVKGNNSILTANRLSIDVTGSSAIGLDATGKKANIDLGTGSQINVEGDGSGYGYGITISGVSTLQANELLITTKGNYGVGLSINQQGTSVNLGSDSTILTSGNGASGVYIFGANGNDVNGPARLSATGLTVKTLGNVSYGFNIQENSIVDLGVGSKINTSGDDAIGIWAFGELKANALTVMTEGLNSTAVEIRDTAVANIGANSHLSSKQAGALVAYYRNAGTAKINFLGTQSERNSIFSGGSYGASAQFNSLINLSYTDINVDRGGALGLGLWALGGGVIKGDNLTINGAAGTRGVYAMMNAQIDLTGDTTIHMANPADMAIATQQDDGYRASRINADGKMDIVGGILSRGGLINIDMQSGSQWTGRAYSDHINGGALNITMTDSRWNITEDSNVDKLILHNTTIDFNEDKAGSVLTVGDLSGNGSFVLHTDLVNGHGDKLMITGSSAGEHKLTVLNRGGLATTGNEVLTVVETQDGQANFASTRLVELGGYLYDVRKNGTNWELYSSGTYTPPPEPLTPDPKPKPEPKPKPPITTSADAGANFLNIGYLLNYAETQTLLQRMGDLRQNGHSGDMWLRGFAGKFDSFAGGKLSRFDMNYNGMQLGADKQVTEQVPVFIGLFTGLTKGSPNYASGDGTVKSHHFGMYASYMAPDGFYLDGVVKYSRLKNEFSVRDSQNNRVNGDGNSDGISFSLESGQKLSLGQQDNGFYIEPQAQLSYSHQDAVQIKASNGLKVALGSYESMIGRASAVVGYELAQGNNSLNVYLKTGYLHELAGDTDYRLNGSPESHSFKGGWWNNGVGVSAQLSQQHIVYLDLDTSTGNRFNQRQINAGYRFNF
ncbi:P.93 [Pragia fontium]|uniref:autotransporter outer membrane beta-barrel domain-containing protein n=1 Tax=Pragia fontium TaxID=82985 RepID=UPI000DFB85AA|nr:autotransporter outer membrane beta-barrel domain-containing protein [Pragia fontium]SUB82712.1 P.93 [Pragia fontium]